MAYMVAHTEKRKSGDLGVYQIHIDRKTKNHANKEIDNERSHLNYDLVGHEKTTSFKKEILDFIEENKSSKRATRKDAVVLQDWVIGSSQSFFANLSAEETKRYFEVAVVFFQERFGKENVRFATVHMDELTPHMHLGIVPFNAENKLTAKTIFNRECLRNIQEDLPKWFQEHGFDIERGKEKSDSQHLHPEAFKKQVKKAEAVAKEEVFELVIDKVLSAVEELPEAEEKDFEKTNEFIRSIVDDDGQIDYGNLKNWQFFKFIRTIFFEVKQLFARISHRIAVRSAELDSRENTIKKKENALEEKIKVFHDKEEKISKIISGIENKEILVSVNHEEISQIERNINDAKMALAYWGNISNGANYPSGAFDSIARLGFRAGAETWEEREQLHYYNFLNFWDEKTFEPVRDLKEMPWKPSEIQRYLEREQAKLENFEHKVNEIGSLLSEVAQEMKVPDMKGPSGPSL